MNGHTIVLWYLKIEIKHMDKQEEEIEKNALSTLQINLYLYRTGNINKQWMNSDHPTWLMSNYKNSTIYTRMASQNFNNICQTKQKFTYLNTDLSNKELIHTTI